MYTTRVPRPRALRPRHSVVSQWDVLLPLGIAPPDPEIDATEMPEDPAAASAVERRLAEAGVGAGRSCRSSCTSAPGNPFRRWPSASFVDLVCRLASKDPKRRIILTSGPSDAAAAAAIAERRARTAGTPERAGAFVECGEFDLAELRALIGRAALYIGGDSGPLHIAGTTGVPVVGLYGPTLAGAIAAVSKRALHQRGGGSAGSAVPAVQSAPMRARRFSVPDRHFGRSVAALAERASAGLKASTTIVSAATEPAIVSADGRRSADLQVGPKDVHES